MKTRPQNACIILCHCCFFHAQLIQSEVDSYCDSIPPSCQLELHLQRTAQPYERLSRQIKVIGIQGISSITIARDIDPGKIKVIIMKHACAIRQMILQDYQHTFCVSYITHVICN